MFDNVVLSTETLFLERELLNRMAQIGSIQRCMTMRLE
jgi:hypothetical protein